MTPCVSGISQAPEIEENKAECMFEVTSVVFSISSTKHLKSIMERRNIWPCEVQDSDSRSTSLVYLKINQNVEQPSWKQLSEISRNKAKVEVKSREVKNVVSFSNTTKEP